MLPSLTEATGGSQGTVGADDPGTAAGGATTAQPSWLKPLMTIGGPGLTIGGGIAAIRGFSKGPGWLKFAGIGAALTGVGMTIVGNRQAGIEEGTKATEQEAVAAIETLKARSQQELNNVSTEAATKLYALQQELAALKQSGGGTSGAPTGGSVGPNGGSTPGGAPSTNGTPTTPGTTTPTGAWSIQGLVGTSVQLTAGTSASGVAIADEGAFRLHQVAGDPNGYATIDEANSIARQSMSTELMGSRDLRWMVVEHDGRYYGVVAKKLGAQDQPNPLQANQGNVVAWSALNHVDDEGKPGWQAFSWSKDAGAQSMKVPYGTTNVYGGSVVGISGGGPAPSGPGSGSQPSPTTSPAPSSVVDQAINSVTGGGAGVSPVVTGQAFDPAAQIGRTFSINASNTVEGLLARGGVLQIQRFVESSAGGFGTAEEAARATREARAASGGGDQWSRWISVQGSDGRFYVYEGSIVKRATAELQTAAPVHVFGNGFAEYFDAASSAWKAVADKQDA